MSQKHWNLSRVSRVLGASIMVLAGALPLTAEAQWVLVARHVVGRVQQITQQQDNAAGTPQRVTQVATVVLDAPANRVYQVATNATNTNQQITVVSNDPATMTINIREADQLATLKIMVLVLPSCMRTPFTSSHMCSFCGLGTSSRVTSHGPMGPKVSQPLPLSHVPPRSI